MWRGGLLFPVSFSLELWWLVVRWQIMWSVVYSSILLLEDLVIGQEIKEARSSSLSEDDI